MSNGQVWRVAQERLRQQMTRAQFDTWLRGTWLSSASDGATLLCVRTTFAKELLESRFRDRIEAAIAEASGQPCRLRVVVAASGPEETEPADKSPAAPRLTGTQAHHVAPTQARVPQTEMASLFAPEPEGTPEDTLPRAVIQSASPAEGRARAALGSERTHSRVDGPSGRDAEQRAWDDTEMEDASGDEYGLAKSERLYGQRSELGGSASMNGQSDGGTRFARGDDGDSELESGAAPRGYGYPTPPLERPGGDGSPGGAYSGGLIQPPKLNPRYTFETFIVGGGNRLAHAASQAVAEAPGMAYNPLFLYGDVGLGKTHLLHAIGHTALSSELVVLYVSAETFTNEIVEAIRYRTTEEFRAKYRSVDVLLVDDIQFIAGKDSTEEEFFHTFNALHESNKQIVMCSDRPPKAIVSLAERLRSRFEWGLIADIQAPDLETRVAILRAKAEMMRRDVPDEVMTYLASRVQSNIRELEGSFNRLFAFAQLQGLPLTTETAKAALASLSTDGRQRRVSVQEVLDAVAEYYRMSPDELRGKQRDKHIVVPRQVAMYLMRQETDASLLEVGQALGGRDHSTVLHGYEKIAREMNEGSPLRKEVLAIQQQLRG